jgi:hypothetical protein
MARCLPPNDFELITLQLSSELIVVADELDLARDVGAFMAALRHHLVVWTQVCGMIGRLALPISRQAVDLALVVRDRGGNGISDQLVESLIHLNRTVALQLAQFRQGAVQQSARSRRVAPVVTADKVAAWHIAAE